jgi:hypothetical protein
VGKLRPLRSLLCVAALLSLAVREARAEEWLPLADGNLWSYRSTHDIQYEYPDRPIVRAFWSGNLIDRVDDASARAATQADPTLHALVSESRDFSDSRATADSRRFVQLISTGKAGVRLHAIRTPDAAPPRDQPVRYSEALLLLRPELVEGASWRVGALVVGNLAVDLTATVTGREDVVVPAGSYPGAWMVRFAGPVTGTVDVVGELAHVDSGRYERRWWLAPGVGLLKEEVDLVFHGVIGEKTPVDGHSTTRRELIAFRREP